MIHLQNVTASYVQPDGVRRTVLEDLSLRIGRGEYDAVGDRDTRAEDAASRQHGEEA